MENKWLMFKNYMHNELGITKEDIREWIQEAVENEAKRMVQQEFNSFDVKNVVKRMVYNDEFFGSQTLKRQLTDEVSKNIMERIEFKNK